MRSIIIIAALMLAWLIAAGVIGHLMRPKDERSGG